MRSRRQAAPRHRTRPDALALRIGEIVRGLRLERGFTFDAFVEETGLGRGYVSELERGLVVPGAAALAKLAGALEVTIADLVLGATERELLFGELRAVPTEHVARIRRELRARYRIPAPDFLKVAEKPKPRG
jgi:transcriptional regulator with XRE-family HTH domain